MHRVNLYLRSYNTKAGFRRQRRPMPNKAKELAERFVSLKMMRKFINARLKDLTEEQTTHLYRLVRRWTEEK